MCNIICLIEVTGGGGGWCGFLLFWPDDSVKSGPAGIEKEIVYLLKLNEIL